MKRTIIAVIIAMVALQICSANAVQAQAVTSQEK